jgi:transcription initiation factor TFIID TATA-box-binding protein
LSQLVRFFRRQKPQSQTKNTAWTHIENVVASTTLHEEIDLPRIANLFPNSSYRPGTFPGLVLKQKQPKMTWLLFRSGKMVCTGTKSIQQAHAAIHQIIRRFQLQGVIQQKDVVISINNMVASGYVGGRIRLEQAAFRLRRALYDPEQFSGIIYRMNDPQVVMLIFASGRLICTGAKRESDIHEAITMLMKQLKRHSLIDS